MGGRAYPAFSTGWLLFQANWIKGSVMARIDAPFSTSWQGEPRLLERQVLLVSILALVGAISSACATFGSKLADYQKAWIQSDEQLAKSRSAEVYQKRKDLIVSPLFASLPQGEQHDRLLSTATLGLQVQDPTGAHLLALHASEMPQAGFEDWDQRFKTAYASNYLDDETVALTHIAENWSGQLSTYKSAVILKIAERRRSGNASRVASFELRMALYRAYWRAEYRVAPSRLWGELAMEVAEQGDAQKALEIVSHVDSPRALIAMRVDKRFDELVSKSPELFDVEAAADRQVRDYEEAASRYPRSLDVIVQLCYAYEDAGRYEDILRVTNVVLSYETRPDELWRHFDEDETAVNWILDLRGDALQATKHWEEAKAVMRLAADGLEHRRRNVSNLINLVLFEADLGQGDAALKILEELPEDDPAITVFGRMQWHRARLAAALEKGDSALAEQSLDYMRAHQQDSVLAYQQALVRMNRLDDAAKILIARLADANGYNKALQEAQLYDDPPLAPSAVAEQTRRRQLIDRPDVQEAIAKVGHIERFGIPSANE